MALANSHTSRDAHLKENGRLISSKDMALRSGPMGPSTRAHIIKGSNRDMVSLNGPMGVFTKDNLRITNPMGKASMSGKTAECTKANGITAVWQVVENFTGRTEDIT